jgi:hypothetical protein
MVLNELTKEERNFKKPKTREKTFGTISIQTEHRT